MNPARELSKLTLKIGSMQRSTPSTSSEAVKPQDVSYALSRLKAGAYFMIRYKYALDDTMLKPLKFELTAHCIKKQLLDRLDNDIALQLITLAIEDATGSEECKTCRGVGHFKTVDEKITCQTCSGTGKRQMGVTALAGRLGMSRTKYATYKDTYQRILGVLISWEDHGLSHVKKKLG